MPGKKERTSGSPIAGEPAFLTIGKLRRPHGLHGELVMEIHTDFPERIEPGARVFLGEQYIPVIIRSRRYHNEGMLVGFEGVDTPEAAGRYRNLFVFTSNQILPDLEENEYYYHQLIGLRVQNENGDFLGVLTAILETGANDVYLVTGDHGEEILLPAIAKVILNVDLTKNTIRVHMLPGLIKNSGE